MKTMSDLKPDPKNARRHNPRNTGQIERSIQTNGFGRSLLLANDGTIIAGNATKWYNLRMEETHIYVLIDPNTGNIRYVGKADDVRRRLVDHLGHCGERATHCHRWLWQLKQAGQSPILRVVETVAVADWPDRERYWIAHFREQGASLTNTAEGGKGALGAKHTDEYRRRASEAAKRTGQRPTPSPDHYRRLGEMFTGRAHTEEARQKISARFKGIPLSKEHRAKLAERKIERFTDPQHREALSRRWAVLTDEQVIEVWRLAWSGTISQEAIAKQYGIPQSSVSEIKFGKRYKHVPRPEAV